MEFPSITICNLNQLEADNLKQLNVYGDMQKTNALLKEFITGYEGNLTKEERDTIKMMKDSGAQGLDLDKVEKILKGSLNSIPSPSRSVKIQIMSGKVCYEVVKAKQKDC